MGFGARVPPQGKVLHQNCHHHHHKYHPCDPTQKARKGTAAKVISLSQVSHNFNLSLSSSSPYCKVSPKHVSFAILFPLFSILYFLSKVLFPPQLQPNNFMSGFCFEEIFSKLCAFCSQKITDSSNIIPQGIDGVISAYYKVVVNNSYQ